MEPIAGDAPEDARVPTTEVKLRGLFQAERVVLGFPLAFFPPFIVTAAIAHSVPAVVSWMVTLVGTAVLWPALALRPSVGFTADALTVRLMFTRRRIAWADITAIRLEDVTDSETDAVNHRVVTVTYRRDPERPLPPMPTRFGDFRQWNREYFRTVRLPLSFPVPQTDGRRRSGRESRFARRRERQRETIRRELAARGYPLSD